MKLKNVIFNDLKQITMKTAAEKTLEWINKFYEINGTPNLSEIKAQLQMAIDEEKEVKNNVSLDVVSNCKHSYVMIGHQFNGHYECTKCKHQKDL